MFDLDTFITDCLAATTEHEPPLAIEEILTRAMSEPTAVARALPAERAGIERLHVYGGDFFNQRRSEFDPDTLEEAPYRVERTLALFDH